MPTVTTNYLEIIEQLTPEVPVVFHNVSWDEYEQLLEELGEAQAVHVSYDRGTLELMAISTEHCYYAEMLQNLGRFVSVRLKFKFRSFGQPTMKKHKSLAGKEPDGCYYVKSHNLIGKRIRIDFAHDPPPDVVVEIDLSTNTIPKLPIYQRLQVPEVWLYDGYEMTIYRLSAGGYKAVPESLEMPGFTSALLTDFLNASQEIEDDNELLAEYVEKIVQSQTPSA